MDAARVQGANLREGERVAYSYYGCMVGRGLLRKYQRSCELIPCDKAVPLLLYGRSVAKHRMCSSVVWW